MKPLGLLGFWRLCYFSQPVCDRALYKWVARLKPRSIVEGSMVSIDRSINLIRVAQRVSPGIDIHYLGLDEFEGRPSPVAGLTLRNSHKLLIRAGAKPRLLPGDPLGTLVRMANQLQKADLFILTLNQEQNDLDLLWFFLPRLMHEQTHILLRRHPQADLTPEVLTLPEIASLARPRAA